MSPSSSIWDPQAYDHARHRLVPSFNLLYNTVATVVSWQRSRPVRVLDLGAGTGLLCASIRAHCPDARLTLVDRSRSMLNQARTRFQDDDSVAYVQSDLTDALPRGPYDAIVSALAIHHLSDTDKRALFRRIRAVLDGDGVFLNIDQVAAPAAWLEAKYAACHEQYARLHGSDDAEWAAAVERMQYDRSASLDDQLAWLREAGFATVDCLVKRWRFVVYAGWTGQP
ncbi:MAG TPA: class I SAM-dependent methyltransferase [Chloroflexota bacterium]|nr:class I SAM-dependent methyltransferase [Chloroflexota bacterium]